MPHHSPPKIVTISTRPLSFTAKCHYLQQMVTRMRKFEMRLAVFCNVYANRCTSKKLKLNHGVTIVSRGQTAFFRFSFWGGKRVWTTAVSCLVLLSIGIWVGVNCIKESGLLSYPPRIAKTSMMQ